MYVFETLNTDGTKTFWWCRRKNIRFIGLRTREGYFDILKFPKKNYSDDLEAIHIFYL